MNIFFIIRSLANRGGVERTLTDKANYLASIGHKVTMVTYEQRNNPIVYELCDGVKYVDLDCPYYTLYRFSLICRVKESLKMKRLFKRRLHNLVNEICPNVIVTPTYTSEFMKEILSAKDKAIIVVESHTAFTYDILGGTLTRRLRNYFYLQLLKKCDMLIVLTKGDAHCWQKHIKNVRFVINPVSYYSDTLENIQKVPGRIIAVGRLHLQKRFDRLIDAFSLISRRNPLWYIDIFGGGMERSKLEKKVVDLGLSERVHLLEPTKDIFSEYKKSQIFVLSSDYEGLPLALLEAMACGVAPISTKCPFGPDEVIEDGVTGLLANMEVVDLAQKMEWMITHEKERLEIGQNAHQAAAQYKKEQVMKKWEHTYQSII